MIFKLSIDDDESKKSKRFSWFFDYDIPYHIKKDYQDPVVRKKDHYCPLVCYGLDVSKNELIESNKLLIPKFGPVNVKIFMFEVYYIVYFKFCYLGKEQIFPNNKIRSNTKRFSLNIREV